MQIMMNLAFSEQSALRLLNWLALENRIIIEANPQLPLLYDSHIRYGLEKNGEIWSDYIQTLLKGEEDCDSLAAIRAGELMARGWTAMRPGDEGYVLAQSLRPGHIPAEVMITTWDNKRGGSYHCITRYKISGHWFRDDPSERLGMSEVLARSQGWK